MYILHPSFPMLIATCCVLNTFKSNLEATVDKLNLIQIESKIFIK